MSSPTRTAAMAAALILALTAVPGIAAVAAAGARLGAEASAGGAAPAAPLATGDPRGVRRPAVPRTCRRLSATRSATDGAFAAATELAAPDTERIQAALDACAGTGRAVVLGAGTGHDAFLSAPLTVRRGEVLLLDGGVTLYASRDPRRYQLPGGNTCGTITASATDGCAPFITMGGSHAGVMGTRAGDGRLGVIDGRGEMTMLGSDESWWTLAERAKAGGNQNNPKLVQSRGVNDLTFYDVELANSPMYHLLITDGSGLTAWNVVVDTPAAGARNTDGIDPESERDVSIVHDTIQDGDDCIAIKSDPGVPSRDITVRDIRCYGTHGISIGSQTAGGIANILVVGDMIDGIDSLGNVSTSNNGIRIKSDALVGGVTRQVSYRGICMTGVKNPLYFNPFYAAGGSSIPTFTDIVVNGVRAIDSPAGTKSLFAGYDDAHPLGLDLEHVALDVTAQTSAHADIGLTDSNVVPSGPDVRVTPVIARGHVPACQFPSFGYPPLR